MKGKVQTTTAASKTSGGIADAVGAGAKAPAAAAKGDAGTAPVGRARGGIVPGVAAANSKPAAKSPPPVQNRKRGGKVHGQPAKHRLDKRARGGRMSPSSPFSGANAPNLGYAHASPHVDKGGTKKG